MIQIANCLQDYLSVFTNVLCLENWSMYSEYLTHGNVYGVCGIHPMYSFQYNLNVELNLRKALSNVRIICLGEIGFDLTR